MGTLADALRQSISAGHGDSEGNYGSGQHACCQSTPALIQPQFTSSPQNTLAQKLLYLPGRSKSLYLQQLHHTTFFGQVIFQRAGKGAPWDDSDRPSPHRFGQPPPTAKKFGQAWQAPQHARWGLRVSKATKRSCNLLFLSIRKKKN